MQLRTPRARFLAAFAVALGVHFLLALAVMVASRRRVSRPHRLEVELRPAKPGAGAPQSPRGAPPAGGPDVAAAPAPPAIQLPPAAAEPRIPRDRTSPPASTARAQRGGEEPRAGADQPPGAAGPERGSKEWLGAEGVAREGSGMSLTLRDPIGSLSGPAPAGEPPQGPVRVPTPEEQLAEEKTRVAQRIGGWSTDILAQRRAEEPHDAYWRSIGDALAKGLEVDVGLGKLKVLVRIVQREDGSVESADVAGPSGNRAYDDRVVRKARDLGRTLLGTPPDGRRQTLWAVEVDSLLFLPAPLAGCTLDSNMLPGECFFPFKKYVRPRVKLQAIY